MVTLKDTVAKHQLPTNQHYILYLACVPAFQCQLKTTIRIISGKLLSRLKCNLKLYGCLLQLVSRFCPQVMFQVAITQVTEIINPGCPLSQHKTFLLNAQIILIIIKQSSSVTVLAAFSTSYIANLQHWH